MFNVQEDYETWKRLVYKTGKAFSEGSTAKEKYINYLNDSECLKPAYFIDCVCKDMEYSEYIYRELVMCCIETYRYFNYARSIYSNEELCEMAIEALKKLGKTERSAWTDKTINPIKINSSHRGSVRCS